MIEAITPLIITFDEAPNIARTLDKLAWARRIVVVDSGSSDGTLEILARYPQVALFKRAFDNFADQCNFGLAQVESEWVLSLDADYEMSDRLVEELSNLRERRKWLAIARLSSIAFMAGRCGERFIRRESFFIVSRTRAMRMKVMGTGWSYRETCVR